MTLFWIIAAGLIVIALGFAALPMLRNKPLTGVDADELNLSVVRQQLAELESDLANGNLEQAQYEAARRDLERELLQDVQQDGPKAAGAARSGLWAVAVLAAGIPLGAVGVYQSLGSQEIITRLATLEKMTAGSPRPVAQAQNQSQPASTPGDHAEGMPPMDQLVDTLHQRLMAEPGNIEGWILLGRSYLNMGRIDDALNAYQSAYQQAPNEPEVLVAYAQALARTNNGAISGQPAELVRKAYEADPKHPTALWMMGLIHFEQGEYQTTIEYWQQLSAMLPPDSDQRKELARFIEQAQERMQPDAQIAMVPPAETEVQTQAAPKPVSQSQPQPQVAPEPQPASNGSGAISVRVSLDPALATQAGPGDRVFIFARALNGPPMPLAAVSKQVRDLPLELTLDDGMAMMPQMKLSGFPQVVVGARISKAGTAMPQSGDLQGEVSPVSPGQADPVSVVIDSVRP
jgi:cytochrome c-type biogenesis protein CcmH